MPFCLEMTQQEAADESHESQEAPAHGFLNFLWWLLLCGQIGQPSPPPPAPPSSAAGDPCPQPLPPPPPSAALPLSSAPREEPFPPPQPSAAGELTTPPPPSYAAGGEPSPSPPPPPPSAAGEDPSLPPPLPPSSATTAAANAQEDARQPSHGFSFEDFVWLILFCEPSIRAGHPRGQPATRKPREARIREAVDESTMSREAVKGDDTSHRSDESTLQSQTSGSGPTYMDKVLQWQKMVEENKKMRKEEWRWSSSPPISARETVMMKWLQWAGDTSSSMFESETSSGSPSEWRLRRLFEAAREEAKKKKARKMKEEEEEAGASSSTTAAADTGRGFVSIPITRSTGDLQSLAYSADVSRNVSSAWSAESSGGNNGSADHDRLSEFAAMEICTEDVQWFSPAYVDGYKLCRSWP